MNHTEINSLYSMIKNKTFICDTCHNVIFPELQYDNAGIDVIKKYRTVTGVWGNKICTECSNKLFVVAKTNQEIERFNK